MLYQTWDLAVTDGCNLKCSYCFANPVAKDMKMLNREDFDRIFDIFMNSAQDKDNFFKIYGGEPMLNKDIWYFLDKFVGLETVHELTFSIITNGTQFTDENLEKIAYYSEKLNDGKNQRFGISISIDGDKENHDTYRRTVGGQPTYDDVIRNLKKLIKVKEVKRIGLQSVLTPYFLENADRIMDSLAEVTALDERIDWGIVPMFDDTFKSMSFKEIDTLFEKAEEGFINHLENFKSKSFSLFQFERSITSLNNEYDRSWCNAGLGNLSFCPDKKIYPCNRFYHEKLFHLSMIDLKDFTHLSQIKESGKKYQQLSRGQNNCSNCSHGMKNSAGCIGLCIVNNLLFEGDFTSKIVSVCRYNSNFKRIAERLYSLIPDSFHDPIKEINKEGK